MNLKRVIIGPLLAIIFLVFFMYMIADIKWFFDNSVQNNHKEAYLASVSSSVENIAPTPVTNEVAKPLTEPEVNAESAISVESNFFSTDKIIFKKDSDKKLPIASLTKLMTAVIVLDNYNLSDNIVVDKFADSQDPMKLDVKLGDKMPVESFLEIMLIESSNKSAYALSEKIGETKFVGLMNEKAKELGLQDTSFADPTGLSPNDISSADDLTKLAEYILKNYPKIGDISRKKELYVYGFGNVENTDELLGEIPEIVCSKTGFTDAAKGCLLLVTNNPKNNDYIISVILGADDRFSEMEKIINYSSAVCN